jgi:hypothetical protein
MIRFPMSLALMLPLAAAVSAWAGAVGEFADFTYDAESWVVTGQGRSYLVRHRSDDDVSSMTVHVGGGTASCSPAALLERPARFYEHHEQTIRRPGFDIHVVISDLGCRNARPPSIHACTVLRGKVYFFDAPVTGCRGGPGFGASALDFLNTLRAAE